MTEIFLCLGSNIGNRLDFIQQAVRRLSSHMEVLESSNYYETYPWGKTDQSNFLNFCLKAKTSMPPEALLALLKEIEIGLGRKQTKKWEPREIDIDILFYGGEIVELPGLTIPHPHLHKRAFVLVPLNEIAADFIHPIFNKKISELTESVDKTGIVLYET